MRDRTSVFLMGTVVGAVSTGRACNTISLLLTMTTLLINPRRRLAHQKTPPNKHMQFVASLVFHVGLSAYVQNDVLTGGPEQLARDRAQRASDWPATDKLGGEKGQTDRGLRDCSDAVADAVANYKALELQAGAAQPCPSPTPMPPQLSACKHCNTHAHRNSSKDNTGAAITLASNSAAGSTPVWMPEPIRVVSVRSLPIWESFEVRYIFSEQREFKVTRVGWDEKGTVGTAVYIWKQYHVRCEASVTPAPNTVPTLSACR